MTLSANSLLPAGLPFTSNPRFTIFSTVSPWFMASRMCSYSWLLPDTVFSLSASAMRRALASETNEEMTQDMRMRRMLPLRTCSLSSRTGSPVAVSDRMMLYPTITDASVAAAEAVLMPKMSMPSSLVSRSDFRVATAARYFPPIEATSITAATPKVSQPLKNTLKSMSMPTLMRKKGMNSALPTNSTRFISVEVRGISWLSANPAKKAPMMASTPATSASNDAR